MALSFDWVTGSDLTFDRERTTVVRKGRVTGTLPYTSGGDAFDYIASWIMSLIAGTYRTYSTAAGILFWNSIQLHEHFYAKNYDVTVTYSPLDHQSGTYQIVVDQAVGNVHVTAGVRVAGFDGTGTCPNNNGVFHDGTEVTGTEVPVAEDRITIMFRHPQAYLNAAYIRAIGKLRGYPNSDIFLGYAAGEVRYMGGSFTQTNAEATASYNFDISPNVTNLVIGDATVTSKSGFDVVSPIYEAAVDGNDNGVRKILGVEVIRPREHKAYRSVFGWG